MSEHTTSEPSEKKWQGKFVGEATKKEGKTPNKCTTYNNTSSRELKDPLRTVTAEKKDENKQEKKGGGWDAIRIPLSPVGIRTRGVYKGVDELRSGPAI